MVELKKPTNDGVAIATASAEILPENSRRRYAIIVNASDVGVWIAFGQPAIVGTGAYLAPGGGSYEIDGDNLFRGQVNGIAVSGSGKVVGTVEFA